MDDLPTELQLKILQHTDIAACMLLKSMSRKFYALVIDTLWKQKGRKACRTQIKHMLYWLIFESKPVRKKNTGGVVQTMTDPSSGLLHKLLCSFTIDSYRKENNERKYAKLTRTFITRTLNINLKMNKTLHDAPLPLLLKIHAKTLTLFQNSTLSKQQLQDLIYSLEPQQESAPISNTLTAQLQSYNTETQIIFLHFIHCLCKSKIAWQIEKMTRAERFDLQAQSSCTENALLHQIVPEFTISVKNNPVCTHVHATTINPDASNCSTRMSEAQLTTKINALVEQLLNPAPWNTHDAEEAIEALNKIIFSQKLSEEQLTKIILALIDKHNHNLDFHVTPQASNLLEKITSSKQVSTAPTTRRMDALIDKLRNETWSVREATIKVLGNLCIITPAPETEILKTISALFNMLHDQDADVRQAAIEAISKTLTSVKGLQIQFTRIIPEWIDTLTQLLNDEYRCVHETASHALCKILSNTIYTLNAWRERPEAQQVPQQMIRAMNRLQQFLNKRKISWFFREPIINTAALVYAQLRPKDWKALPALLENSNKNQQTAASIKTVSDASVLLTRILQTIHTPSEKQSSDPVIG